MLSTSTTTHSPPPSFAATPLHPPLSPVSFYTLQRHSVPCFALPTLLSGSLSARYSTSRHLFDASDLLGDSIIHLIQIDIL